MNNDLISRSELLRQIRNSQKDNPFQRIGSVAMVWHNVHAHVCSIIDAQEGSDAEPVRHGRWINKTEKRRGFSDYRFDCSACNHIFWASGVETFQYCPNCGAKMTDGDV